MRIPPENERPKHSPYEPDFGKYAYIKTLDDVLPKKELHFKNHIKLGYKTKVWNLRQPKNFKKLTHLSYEIVLDL